MFVVDEIDLLYRPPEMVCLLPICWLVKLQNRSSVRVWMVVMRWVVDHPCYSTWVSVPFSPINRFHLKLAVVIVPLAVYGALLKL